MNIRGITPADLFSTFLLSSVELLDIVVKGAPTFDHAVKRRRRGKRAVAFVRLCQRGHCIPLPGIFLSNVRSLCNKMDELQLLLRKKTVTFLHLLCYASQRCGCVDR